jgi:hypothetical protein
MAKLNQKGSSSCFIAYERKSGRILHAHFFYSAAKDAERSEEELRNMAMKNAASKLGTAFGEISVIAVKPVALNRDRHYKVDTKTGKLVAVRGKETGFTAYSGVSYIRPGDR